MNNDTTTTERMYLLRTEINMIKSDLVAEPENEAMREQLAQAREELKIEIGAMPTTYAAAVNWLASNGFSEVAAADLNVALYDAVSRINGTWYVDRWFAAKLLADAIELNTGETIAANDQAVDRFCELLKIRLADAQDNGEFTNKPHDLSYDI